MRLKLLSGPERTQWPRSAPAIWGSANLGGALWEGTGQGSGGHRSCPAPSRGSQSLALGCSVLGKADSSVLVEVLVRGHRASSRRPDSEQPEGSQHSGGGESSDGNTVKFPASLFHACYQAAMTRGDVFDWDCDNGHQGNHAVACNQGAQQTENEEESEQPPRHTDMEALWNLECAVGSLSPSQRAQITTQSKTP